MPLYMLLRHSVRAIGKRRMEVKLPNEKLMIDVNAASFSELHAPVKRAQTARCVAMLVLITSDLLASHSSACELMRQPCDNLVTTKADFRTCHNVRRTRVQPYINSMLP